MLTIGAWILTGGWKLLVGIGAAISGYVVWQQRKEAGRVEGVAEAKAEQREQDDASERYVQEQLRTVTSLSPGARRDRLREQGADAEHRRDLR